MVSETRRYHVIIKLQAADPQRLVQIVPRLQAALERASVSNIEQVFRSATADIFGYFIQSKLSAQQVLVAIETPAGEPFLDGKDAVFVFVVGEQFMAGKGFTRAGTWLQRH